MVLLLISKIIEIIISAGAAQGFFLGMLLTTKKNKKRTSNKVLAALLIVLSVSILHSLLATEVFDSPYKIRQPFVLLIGPLLSFYISELIGTRKITWTDVLHFIPFVLLIFILMPVWTHSTSSYSNFLHEKGLIISKAVWALIVFQFGYYWWSILSVLQRHRLAVESEFSNLEGKTLSWMKDFIHVFGLFLFLLVLTVIIAFHTEHYNIIDTIVCFGLSCTIFALGHNGLFQEEVLSINAAQDERTRQSRPDKTDIQSVARNVETLQKVIVYLQKSKPYLNEALTLTDLAGQVGMTRNQLSSLINNATGENFYTFINKYRVEEVKRLIADPRNMNFTMLSLAYEAGFSSKSAFQSVFKIHTGLTPTEYRRILR
ncbi:MAG: AraC family transcriptional regulator [Bacteriovoracaceae bacterium]